MRRILFLLFFLCGFISQAASTRTELQFGFPGLLALRLDRPISEHWNVGFSFGLVPTFLVSPFFRPTLTQDISDEYNVVFDPSANAFSAGFSAQWQPNSPGLFVRLEVLANIVHGGASSYVVNKSTEQRAPYINLDVTAVIPRFVASVGTRLSHGESWDLTGGLGVTLLISQQVGVSKTGPGAAYFDAVPSVRESLRDGVDEASNQVRSVLSSTFLGAAILPALWVSAVW